MLLVTKFVVTKLSSYQIISYQIVSCQNVSYQIKSYQKFAQSFLTSVRKTQYLSFTVPVAEKKNFIYFIFVCVTCSAGMFKFVNLDNLVFLTFCHLI